MIKDHDERLILNLLKYNAYNLREDESASRSSRLRIKANGGIKSKL